MKSTQLAYPSLAQLDRFNATPTSPKLLDGLQLRGEAKSEGELHHMRDGAVVLYRRDRRKVWQVRFKLFDNRWHRFSTKRKELAYAKREAADMYDRARFKEEMGLRPASVRKHNNTLNAMLNMAFKHLDIDRLSPFRSLKIRGEGEFVRLIPPITHNLLLQVKDRLLESDSPHRLIALIQLNTGMRVSEPSLARLTDCVLDHDIPHLWVRKNSITDRKTKTSIRAVPLVGVSLVAAKKLYAYAQARNSEWLVPNYAHENGNSSCSAIINKTLRDLNFRSHMFRHAFIDRMKACNDIPTRVAESITGHSRGGSEFDSYGTVGYTLEQKLGVIKRVEI